VQIYREVILHPIYYRVLQKQGSQWLLHGSKLTSANNTSIGIQDLDQYNLSLERLINDLFRVNAGRDGFYIANLKDKQYYYCGLTADSVKTQFLSLGIGRVDPNE
jgi:hypothetical protein